MKELSHTESLCSECLQRIPATIVQNDGRISMRKECPRHGRQDALISSDAEWYHRAMSFSPHLVEPASRTTASINGCPMDCGYCTVHRQRMYLPVVPVTSACDLNCPVCYTINKNRDAYFMTKEEFAAILEHIREQDAEMQIINFTGGKPLLHPEFCDLVEMCQKAGIHRITISTNGLRFLEKKELLPRLTELGARIVFSFNSFNPEPYLRTAGTDLLEKKLNILALLEEYRTSTTLLTVVAAGINDQEIGDIVRYILRNDFVVSSEIHTVTFTGQSAGGFERNARLTVPDVIADITEKNKNITKNDFLPSPCAHPLCYTTCSLLKLNNGETTPLTSFISEQDVFRMLSGSLYIEPNLTTEEMLTDALNDLWSKEKPTEKDEQILMALRDLVHRMYPSKALDHIQRQRVAESATKAIYIHSHMDADNFDVKRIANCCVAVPDRNGACIPTCAYNNIYRARDPRFCESADHGPTL